MVSLPDSSWLLGAWLFAQAKTATALERMTPQQRAKVLAALAAFIILGFGLMALAWVGARVTRHYMNQGSIRRRDQSHTEEDWTTQPLYRHDGPDDPSE